MKLKFLLGLILSFSLFFTGCGGGSGNKVEFDKSKDYKPDEVKQIVFHDKQTDDLLQLVNKKLTPEEAKNFKRSILLVHQIYGAKAEGKTIGELLNLKLSREEILKFKFDPNNYQAAYEAVSFSELTDTEQKAFETCVRGYDPRKWAGKTIGEMLEQREKDKKVEQTEQKPRVTPSTPPTQSSNFGIRNVSAPELISNCINFVNPPNNPYGNQMIAITGKVLGKGTTNDGMPFFVIYENKQNYSVPVDDKYQVKGLNGTDGVIILVNDVQTLNRLQQDSFIKVTGKCVHATIGKPYKTRYYRRDNDSWYKKNEEATVGDRFVYIQADRLEY